MQRALDLASLGLGRVSPNPMVGAVVVHEGKIIGEGYHTQFGAAHAEVEAIKSVKDKALLAESTIYVTLEPCSHYGKTPPCSDLLIETKVKKVMVAMQDPNPLVAGKGIAKLRQAGIEVEVGILEAEARMLNRRFVTFHEKHRPYIILKWAETADGFIAPSLDASRQDKQISNLLSQQIVHKWRAEEDAIMVGMNTLLHDNPKLNIRFVECFKQPIRIVLDEKGVKLTNLHFLDGLQPSIVFNFLEEDLTKACKYYRLDASEEPFRQMMDLLFRGGVGSLIVEGGAKLIKRLLDLGLWDEARVCVSPKTFGQGIEAPILKRPVCEEFRLNEDTWKVMLNPA